MSLWLQVEQSLFLVYFNLLSKVKSKIIAKKERNMLIIIILNYWCTRDDNGTFFRLVMCQWGELTAGHTRWSEMGGHGRQGLRELLTRLGLMLLLLNKSWRIYVNAIGRTILWYNTCCLNYFLRSFFYVIMLMMITKVISFQ